MAIDRTPVLKRCRQLGIDPVVMGINKTSNREPRRRRRQESEYGMQLREKQKAKFIYGVLENQFHGYYEMAKKNPGITGDNLMSILETRLDNVIFRLGFARTRKEARQTVRHGHITVNGQRVDIPSYRVKSGDVIAVASKARIFFQSRKLSFPPSTWQFLHGLRLTLRSCRALFFSFQPAIRSTLRLTHS